MMTRTVIQKKRNRLPRPWHRFFRGLYGFSLREGYVGDLAEEYACRAERTGSLRAFFWLWRQAVLSLPELLKTYLFWSLDMLRNLIKTAIRNMKRQKLYTAINILGLALGLAASMLILVFVRNEITHDRFHGHGRSVFRVGMHLEMGNLTIKTAGSPAPMGPELAGRIPGITAVTRLKIAPTHYIRSGEELFEEESIVYAETSVFDLFTVEFVRGDPGVCLEAPFCVVITEELAERLFGSRDPLGEMVTWEDGQAYTVTGVVRKTPVNSYLRFEMLVSLSTLYRVPSDIGSWRSMNYLTFLRVADENSTAGLGEKLSEAFLSSPAMASAPPGAKLELLPDPLQRIHLHARMSGDLDRGGSITLVLTLTAIGFLILGVACINFMNLSTARYSRRAMEVGLRKVIGADRKRVAFQFLGESVVLSLTGIAAAFALMHLFLPMFCRLVMKELSFHPWKDWDVTLLFAGLGLSTGFLSGLYPALFLSSFRPSAILTGRFNAGKGHRAFRNTLVVLQFVVSIALIICTLVIFRQMDFIQEYDLGLDRDRVMGIPLQGQVGRNPETFKAEVLNLPGVARASCSSLLPGWGRTMAPFSFEGVGKDGPEDAYYLEADEDFVETMGMSIVSGRDFSDAFPGDASSSVLVNETLLRDLGWETAPGKAVRMGRSSGDRAMSVVGVVRDFHFESLHEPIKRMVITRAGTAGDLSILSVKLDPERMPDTIGRIERLWSSWEPSIPFEFRFLDEKFEEAYRRERQIGRTALTLAAISILIACMGLFGLASYTADRRTKEIGIRKTLGASAGSVAVMLSGHFTRWVILANAVAWPAAYLVMKAWLRQFAYRVDLAAWMFVVSGLTALVIAWLTVSSQTLRAAMRNPVDTLRYE